MNRRTAALRHRSRGGAATIEFAIVAPIFFLLILGLVQFAGLLMSKNVLTGAARDGSRVAALPGTISTGTVIAHVEESLSRGGIDPSLVSVVVTPAALANLNTGDEITVTLSAALCDMTWIWAIDLPDITMSAQMTFQRE